MYLISEQDLLSEKGGIFFSVLLLKVSKSQKQIIFSQLLTKNEPNSSAPVAGAEINKFLVRFLEEVRTI